MFKKYGNFINIDNFKKDIDHMNEDELWEHFEICLRLHDWYYDYSDDKRCRYDGLEKERYLRKIFSILVHKDEYKAKILWCHYNLFLKKFDPKDASVKFFE